VNPADALIGAVRSFGASGVGVVLLLFLSSGASVGMFTPT
jgi:hypothetical protein